MNAMVKEMLSASYMELEHLTFKASMEELQETYDIMADMKCPKTKLDMISRAIAARTPMKDIMLDMRKKEVREKFEAEWTSMQKMFEGLKAKKRERLAVNE